MRRGPRGEDYDPGKHVLFIVREPSAMLSKTMGLFLVGFSTVQNLTVQERPAINPKLSAQDDEEDEDEYEEE